MKSGNAGILSGTHKIRGIRIAGAMLASLPAATCAAGLGALLHQVEQNAPLLQVAAARADASAAGVRVAKSRYWGHAELFGRDAHFDEDRLVNPINFPPVLSASLFDRDTFGYGATYTLPVDIDGRITADVNAKKHLRKAAAENKEQARLSLFTQTVILYRSLQRQEGIEQALNEQLKALQGHRKVTETSVRVGRVAAVELLRIKAEVKSVEGQLAGIDGDQARLRSELAALLNARAYADPVEALGESPGSELNAGNADDALENRPDIRAAKSITSAEDENLKGARREWLPSLSLQAETMRNQGYTADGQNTWSVTAQVSWQFLDGGRRHGNTDKAHANRFEAKQQYLSTLNQARAELQSATAAWKAAALQYQAATSGLEAAVETERIQSDRFASGRISAVDLIDAEASLARSRSDFTSALADWWLADDQLHLARGEPPTAYKMLEDVHASQ